MSTRGGWGGVQAPSARQSYDVCLGPSRRLGNRIHSIDTLVSMGQGIKISVPDGVSSTDKSCADRATHI